MSGPANLHEVTSVGEWNNQLRTAKQLGRTVIVDFHATCQISAMPTFKVIKQGQVVETIRGADPPSLMKAITAHAGPNPPVAPLPTEAQEAKDLADAAFKAQDFDKALEHYSEAIEHASESPQLYANRSITHLKIGNSSAAVSDAETSVKLSPTWGKAYVRLGDALLALDGQTNTTKARAAEAYEKAVEYSQGTVKLEAQQKLDRARA
ncbi:hypothetical protein OIV83_005866 [Microbotryomycetes sp. JL201]|nr:hypothetical protein OIV83_005866 [Microbotryomycetes sp. JL201]